MSKIIRMTPEMIEEAKRKFERHLESSNLVDGKISYTDSFVPTGQKAIIWYTPEAYAKQIALVQSFTTEVAWHGVAQRIEGQPGQYIIRDILVYPQLVDGTNVNTDQEEYEKWMQELDNDTFNELRMQGHSHVKMPTSPSATDLEHQYKIVQQLEDDMFYIFMIWNKEFKFTAKVYDLKINTLFEPADIDVCMIGGGVGIGQFLDGANKLVKNKPYSYGGNYRGNYQGNYSANQGHYSASQPAATNPSTAQKSTTTPETSASKGTGASTADKDDKEKPVSVPSRQKPCIGNGWGGAGSVHDYMYDDDYYNSYQ